MLEIVGGTTRSGRPYQVAGVTETGSPCEWKVEGEEQELPNSEDEGAFILELVAQEETDADPEEPGGWAESYDSDEEMAHIYGSSKGTRRFSGVVGTIELDDFIIKFGGWCNGQSERRTGFTPFSTWQALFQHLEGAPMRDFAEFEARYSNKIEAFRRHWALDFKNLFGGSILIGGRQVGSGGIMPTEAATSGEPPDEKNKGLMGSKGAPPPFNPIAEFFNLLKLNYQGQRLDKMVELQNFALKDKESYRDAYHRLRRLVDSTEGITAPQSIQYW